MRAEFVIVGQEIHPGRIHHNVAFFRTMIRMAVRAAIYRCAKARIPCRLPTAKKFAILQDHNFR